MSSSLAQAPADRLEMALTPDAPIAASTETYVPEPSVTVCRPIVPLGDVSRSRPAGPAADDRFEGAPFHFIAEGDCVRWRLSADDWRLTSPTLPPIGEKTASAEAVLDVYVGLLAAFAEARMPANNTVSFSPGAFTRRLGWGAGAARRGPTGRLYRQLELALDYLRQASVESEAVREQLEAIQGVRLFRANFSVLQAWTKTGVPDGVGGAVRIEARFSDYFAALIRHDAGVVRYCASKYVELPRGVPRALFRYIEGLRAGAAEPMVTVPSATILAHIGSRRRDLEPSRMKAILDEPHQLLYANRVLGDLPVWSKSDSGEWQLTYLLESTPDLGPLLEETAIAFGITGTLARMWATTRAARLTEILTAAIQGILTPKLTIGAMVHYYLEKESGVIDAAALPHFEEGRGLLRPKQRCQEFEFLQEQYAVTRDWLNERPEIGKALRRQLAGAVVGRPGWVTEGLVLLAARRMRRADDVKAWRKRVGIRR